MYKQIEDILLPILDSDDTFGFFVSGGFDSGLLLYVACLIRETHKLNSTFKVYTVPKHEDSAIHASNIVAWINGHFNIKLQPVFVGDPNQHHSLQVISGINVARSQCKNLILGDTTNPDCMQDVPGAPRRQRTTTEMQPFFEWTKKETVALAAELGLIELMQISHTCTESKSIRCAKCWQCNERAWGFRENNYTDPGTM